MQGDTSSDLQGVLSVSLQQRSKDIAQALRDISCVIKALEEVRWNVDSTHLVWHEEAVLLGSRIGVTLSVPRQCGRQANRDNTPTNDSVSYLPMNINYTVFRSVNHRDECSIL